jgi:alanine-glyoxylate transaminase/serine-glyoxylate transaminase/serine-pyruvate transaminase
MDPQFVRVMNEVREMLQLVFRTSNAMTLACSGTGSAGAEMLMDNLVESGDECLVCVNGVFGGRLADKARRAGGVVHELHTDWGTVFDQDRVIDEVLRIRPAIVAIVHAETSTGVLQPVDRLAEQIHSYGGLLVLDCVTSLGGVPVEIDQWQIDAAYSGTQKCLSCPPGLSPVTLSERAMHKVNHRSAACHSWYLDLKLVGNYWTGNRAYHHTAPVNMNFALHEALRLVLDEGLDCCFARHQAAHNRLCDGLHQQGIRYVADAANRLPMLNLIAVPESIDDEAAVRKQLLDEWSLEIGGGLGKFAGKCWRIGLMGHGAREGNVDRVLKSLDSMVTAAAS